MIGLKFLLDHGHYIQIPVSVEEARRIVEIWTKAWETKTHAILSGSTNVEPWGPMNWCVLTSHITAMHTFSLDRLGSEQQGQLETQVIHGSGYAPQFATR